MRSINELIDDLSLAIADLYAMNNPHETLLAEIRDHESAHDCIDHMIIDHRDDMTDTEIDLIRDPELNEKLIAAIALRLLDFLASA